MKNNIWILPLVLIGLVLIFTNSCKKDKIVEPEPVEEPPVPTITADKSSVNQLEIVSLTPTNITFNQTQYSGTIGGQNADILLSDNKLVFIVPDIPAGTQSLTTTIEGVAYSIPFSIIQVAAVSDPVAYYNNYSSDLAAQMNDLQNYINQMAGIIDVGMATQDMQTIQNYIDASTQNFQNASASEKATAIKFLKANKPWLNDIKLSLDTLSTSINDLINAKKSKSITDYEVKVTKAYFSFRNAVMQVRIGIALVAASVPFMIPPFTFIGAVFVGATVGNLLADIVNVLTKEEQLIDCAYSVNDLISEVNKSNHVFSNNTPKSFTINGTYRNIYNVDKNSNVSMIAGFINSMQSLSSGLSFINSKLPNKLQLTPKIIDNLITKKTTDLTVHAKYLSIANISNNKVTGSAQNNNGEFVLTFLTNEITDQIFNFDIVYNNNGGVTKSITVTGAKVIATLPYSIAKVSGDNQSGPLGYVLTNPIKVIIKDQQNNPCEGATVFFTANNGGSVSQSQVITNAAGQASVNWTLGSTGSTQTVSVKSYKSDGTTHLQGSPLTFSATGSCASIYMVGSYEAVQIGSQVWMAKNLNISTANSWCYENNSANCAKYGRLYNWSAALTACPSGWHLPSDAEWTTLTNFLGGESVAGGKLKETGTTNWNTPNAGATNETCFTALPGGYRTEGESFINAVYYGRWWTSTGYDDDANYAWAGWLAYSSSNVYRYFYDKSVGYSVRCVKN